jgi:hypothetical protein
VPPDTTARAAALRETLIRLTAPGTIVKTPRTDVNDALAAPASRTLLTYLATIEEPVRTQAARETLSLSIAQLGLAMRALERHGLVLRVSRPTQEGSRFSHPFLEATDLGREHARRLQVLAAATPPA